MRWKSDYSTANVLIMRQGVGAPCRADSTSMSSDDANSQRSTGHRTSKVRHTKEDSLSDLEFEQLYNASFQLDPLTDLEARFVLLVGGRLGLRRGEIAHIRSDWIDWRKRRIDIPPPERPGNTSNIDTTTGWLLHHQSIYSLELTKYIQPCHR